MKLHTSLTEGRVRDALDRAVFRKRVTPDVNFTVMSAAGSRSHDRAFDIQLGTEDKRSLPPGSKDQRGKNMNVRRYKNSGSLGAGNVYSATWHEWGWFMAEVFKADPGARFGDKSWGYSSREDFNEKTSYLFAENS